MRTNGTTPYESASAATAAGCMRGGGGGGIGRGGVECEGAECEFSAAGMSAEAEADEEEGEEGEEREGEDVTHDCTVDLERGGVHDSPITARDQPASNSARARARSSTPDRLDRWRTSSGGRATFFLGMVKL